MTVTVHICVYAKACARACLYERLWVSECVRVNARARACVCVCVCVCVRYHMCMTVGASMLEVKVTWCAE